MTRADHASRGARRRTAGAPSAPVAAFQLHGSAAPSPREDRAWTVAAWVLAALSVAGAVAMMLGPHRIGDYFTESDFYGAYAQGARLIQHGRLVPSRYTVVGPGYEIALALVGLVVRELFVAAQLLSAGAAGASVWLWFELLRRRVDARTGFVAAAFIATNAWFFRYSFAATTDAFANALQAAALFALLGAPAPDATGRAAARRPMIAGALAAAAFLTRYNAVYLLPAGLIAILAGATGTASRRRTAAAFAGGFFVLVIPWVLYSLGHGGTLGLQLHHNIAYEVFARSKGIAWDDYQKRMQSEFPNLAAVIARDPAAVARQVVANVGGHLRSDASKLLGWPVAIAAALGLILVLRDRSARRAWPLLVAGALLFLTLVPVFYSERYSLALLPMYATLAGVLFGSSVAALALGRKRRLWLKALAALAVFAIGIPAAVRGQLHANTQLPTEVLGVARALRALRAPGDRVIARKAHIGYYGDCESVAFPFADSLSELASYAREARARWLYFSWPEAETRPTFWHLLDTAGVVPGLAPRYVSSPRPAVLYEIGPGFGARPAWYDNDTLATLHTLRGRASVMTHELKTFEQLGLVAQVLGRYPEARDALARAVTLDPTRAETYVSLGRVLVQMREFEDARAVFGRAVGIAPANAEAHIGLGLAEFLTGRLDAAAREWRPVISQVRDPGIARAMVDLYASRGETEPLAEARAHLERLGGR